MGVAEHLSELPDVRQPLEGVAGEHDWGQIGGTKYTHNWLRKKHNLCSINLHGFYLHHDSFNGTY